MKLPSNLLQPLIYGLPAWPLAMLGIPLYIYLPTYYYQLGLDLGVVGAVLLLARITDVISDPLIGWCCDYSGHRGRYGLIVLGWFLLLISLWQLLLPTATQASALHLSIWAMWVYLAWTLIMIPYQALSAEVSENHHIKTHFTATREAFSILGVLTVLILPFLFTDTENYRILFSVLYPLLALSLSFSLALMLWRLRLVSSSSKSGEKKAQSSLAYRQAALLIWRNAASRTLLPAYFLNSLANAFSATLFLLFVEYYLQEPQYTGLFLLIFFLAGIAALPFWVALSKKIGKYSAWRLSMATACLGFIWVFTVGAGDVIAFAVVSFFAGLSVAADVALPSSIQADIAQNLNTKNGAMSGLLFGVWSMLTKLALALAVGLAFPLLDWVGWEQRTPLSINAVVWLYGGLPIALKILVLLLLRKAK